MNPPMVSVPDLPPCSLGLGGDGDEIAAIREVERRFGVSLDYSDAHRWRTVGDVFSALQQALPAERTTAGDTWSNFRETISQETDVDPSGVTQATLLLRQSRFDWRILFVVSCLMGVAYAIGRLL